MRCAGLRSLSARQGQQASALTSERGERESGAAEVARGGDDDEAQQLSISLADGQGSAGSDNNDPGFNPDVPLAPRSSFRSNTPAQSCSRTDAALVPLPPCQVPVQHTPHAQKRCRLAGGREERWEVVDAGRRREGEVEGKRRAREAEARRGKVGSGPRGAERLTRTEELTPP